MKGVEKHEFEECSVGDWVLCDRRFTGSTKLFMIPPLSERLALLYKVNVEIGPTLMDETTWQFDRTPVEKSRVIMAWLRVR